MLGKRFCLFLIFLFVLSLPLAADAAPLSERLKGRILLQVEGVGQSWYVEPETRQRAFLGRPEDAFRIMRELGLGISEGSYDSFGGYAPANLSGKILLRVEASGEAYYVNPEDLKMHYLGRPDDAFGVMRRLGLGVTDDNLGLIAVHPKYPETSYAEPGPDTNAETDADADADVVLEPGIVEIRFIVAEETESTNDIGEVNINKNRYASTLIIEEGEFEYRDNTNISMIDFADRTITTTDPNNGLYQIYPLLSILDHRKTELDRRAALGDALSRAGVDNNELTAVAWRENLFSLKQDGEDTELVKKFDEASRDLTYTYEDEVLFSVNTNYYDGDEEEYAVSDAEMDMFIQFIRYTFGAHPVVLEDLDNTLDNTIPKFFTVYQNYLSKKTFRLDVVSVNRIGWRENSLVGLTLGSTDPDVNGLLAKYSSAEALDPDAQLASALSGAQTYYDNEKYLDCMLAYLEYTLTTGGELPEQYQEHKDVLMSDADVAALNGYMATSTEEALVSLLKMYELLGKTENKQHIIKIYMGDYHIDLGSMDSAKKMFLEVLDANPNIAGVYKNLGDVYRMSSGVSEAWLSWNIGRALAPTHPAFDPINNLEQELTINHPEYFE